MSGGAGKPEPFIVGDPDQAPDPAFLAGRSIQIPRRLTMDEITHVEIINIAPHGPAKRIVIHSDTDGEARAFEFRSYEISDDGMTELWTLGPEVELEDREPLKSVFKEVVEPPIIGGQTGDRL